MKSDIGWAIKNPDFGFYTGWWLTQKEAIEHHTATALFTHENVSQRWKRCYKNGDRAVKVRIMEIRRSK